MITLFNGDSNKCAGYCNRHHCGMTVKQLKQRKCLQKQCRHFNKCEIHPYWKQREVIKQNKKKRKLALMGG